MALSTKVGAFNTGTAAAGNTVAVTGVGFEPKAILFWWAGTASTGTDVFTGDTMKRGFGVAASPTSRWAIGGTSQNGQANSVTDRIQREDACIAVVSVGGVLEALMDLQSFDADGFTLIVDDAFLATIRVHYLALGGADLTNVSTGRWDEPAATGTQDITTAGFQPDCVLFGSIGSNIDPPNVAAAGVFMVGAAVSASQEAVLQNTGLDGQGTMDTSAYCRAGECIAIGTPTSGMTKRAELDSFLSNGFRLNWLERTADSIFFYLALKGGQYRIDDFLTSTSNGATITETGFGFAPKASMLFSHGRAADTQDVVTAFDQWNVGAFTSTTERGAQGTFDEDDVGDSDIEIYVEHDQALAQITATPSVVGLVDVQSVDADGFTLVMDSAANPAAFVWYLTVGDTGGGTQALTGTLFTNAPTFFTGAITTGVVDLAGTLFANVATFFTGIVTPGLVNLDGVLYTNTPSFPQGDVTTGAVTLDGVLYTNPPIFNTGTVGTSYELVGTLYENPSVFFQGVVAGGDLILIGGLFVNDPVFSQGVIVGFDRVYPYWPTTTDDAWAVATDDGWPVGSELEWQGV